MNNGRCQTIQLVHQSIGSVEICLERRPGGKDRLMSFTTTGVFSSSGAGLVA